LYVKLYAICIPILVASILFTVLGIGFGLVSLTLIAILSHSLTPYVGLVLVAQAAASIAASTARGSLLQKTDALEALFAGIAALVAYFSAFTIGVKLPDLYRVALVTLLLALSIVPTRTSCIRSFKARLMLIASVSVCAGIVKAITGGGLTPVIYLLNRLLGYDFTRSVSRTIISEAPVCIASAIPYLLTYPPTLPQLIYVVLVALIGVVSGSKIVEKASLKKQEAIFKAIILVLILANTITIIRLLME